MIGGDHHHGVNQGEQKHRHAGVSPIVKQRQKFWMQPAQRPDAQDEVQQHKAVTPKARIIRISSVMNGKNVFVVIANTARNPATPLTRAKS